MELDPNQLSKLIALTISVKADEMGCDGCFELMDQLAQAELDGTQIDQQLQAVQNHLEQCKCCRDEYDSLMTALRAIQSESP